MAYAGQTLDNPVSGERIVFRQTSADTNGEKLAFDLILAPDGHVPGKHVHPIQEERFEIVGGSVKFTMGRKKIVAEPGDVVIVPPGIPHKFENTGDSPAYARVEVTPALRMEELFETAVALAESGRTTSKGMPKPLDLALFTKEFEQEVVGAFPPVWMQRASLAPLRWIARRRELPKRQRRSGSSATHPVVASS